jgi:hypothetical protein
MMQGQRTIECVGLVILTSCGEAQGSTEQVLVDPCNAVLCSPELVTADRTAPRVDDAFDTSEDANYGQDSCPHQFVYDIPADLVLANCGNVDSCQAAVLGLWSSVPEAQCAGVLANTTVFVRADEWQCVESIIIHGVAAGDGCFPSVEARSLPLPEFARKDQFYGGIHVPLRNLNGPALMQAIPEVSTVRLAVRAFHTRDDRRLPVHVSVRASEASF